MDSTEYYLGLKDGSGKLIELISFSGQISANGKTIELFFLPSRDRKNLDILEARSFWREKTKQGFSKIDSKLAIAFSAKLNTSEEKSLQKRVQNFGIDRKPEELKEEVKKIINSKRESRTTSKTITRVLFNQDCEYSFTSYSKEDETVTVRYLEYETDDSEIKEYKKDDARKLWKKLKEEHFNDLPSRSSPTKVVYLGNQCD